MKRWKFIKLITVVLLALVYSAAADMPLQREIAIIKGVKTVISRCVSANFKVVSNIGCNFDAKVEIYAPTQEVAGSIFCYNMGGKIKFENNRARQIRLKKGYQVPKVKLYINEKVTLSLSYRDYSWEINKITGKLRVLQHSKGRGVFDVAEINSPRVFIASQGKGRIFFYKGSMKKLLLKHEREANFFADCTVKKANIVVGKYSNANIYVERVTTNLKKDVKEGSQSRITVTHGCSS